MSIISNYQPCLKSFPKHLFSLMIASLKRNARSICLASSKREEMVEKLKCFTPETIPKVATIGHQTMALLGYLDRMNNPDLVLPAMCCGYNLISAHAKSTVDKLCRQNGVGRSGLHYFQTMASSFGSDKLNYLCSTYGNIEICHRKIPHTVNEIKSILNRKE